MVEYFVHGNPHKNQGEIQKNQDLKIFQRNSFPRPGESESQAQNKISHDPGGERAEFTRNGVFSSS